MDNHRSLSPHESREIERPFPLVQELFDFAKVNKINENGFSRPPDVVFDLGDVPKYTRPTVGLTAKFDILVADNPGVYHVVAYKDARNFLNPSKSDGQQVRLCNYADRFQTDEKVTEIDYQTEKGIAGDMLENGLIEVRVKQSILNKTNLHPNEAKGLNLNPPDGIAFYVYEMDENGNKYPKLITFDRWEEGLFEIDGSKQVVRWSRNFTVEKAKNKPDKIVYTESYRIAKDNCSFDSKRADIKTTIQGSLDNPQAILIELDSGPIASAQVLIDDQVTKLKFLVHSFGGISTAGVEIIMKDPLYLPLFKKSPDIAAFLQGLGVRIQAIKEEWDKPTSVYEMVNSLRERVGELTQEK